LRELAEAGLILGKNIFYAHSDAQHPSAPGAIEGGLEAMNLVEAARKAEPPRHRKTFAAFNPRAHVPAERGTVDLKFQSFIIRNE
jgi:hypothetical protein